MKRFKLIKAFLIIGAMGMVLSSCGRKQVEYQEDGRADVHSDTDAEALEEESRGGDIESQLELGDDRSWKETIHHIQGTVGDANYMEYDIDMNAHINIPESNNMYTMTCQKWYLSAEDKKRIMTYFVDESNLKFDIASPQTKEVFQSYIDYINEYPLADTTYISENEDEVAVFVQSLQDIITYYEEKKEESCSEEELYSKPLDYNGCGYEGKTADGITYLFNFWSDAERNRSAFRINRRNYDDEGNLVVPKEKLELTDEYAAAKAEEICSDLGLEGMCVCSVQSEQQGVTLGSESNVKYVVDLCRKIDDIPVDITAYIYEKNKVGDMDDFRVRLYDKSYSREYVKIIFDEYGLEYMFACGMVKNCQVENPVKLLGFEQVKSVLRKELEERQVRSDIYEWKVMDLIYLRIENKDSEEELRYIPVWRLCANSGIFGDENAAAAVSVPTYMLVFVNAMDGSIIDLDEAGVGCTYKMSHVVGGDDYENTFGW